MSESKRAVVLVLASTYPRWSGDVEPGFVHELNRRLASKFDVIAVVPNAPGADKDGMLDGVEVIRYRYAPRRLETLVNNGGIVINLRCSVWKWLLVPGFILGQYWAIRSLLSKRHVDVVHAHWLIPQGLVANSVKRVSAIPYLVTSHGGDLFGLGGRVLSALKRRVASSASAMTVVSSAMRDEVVRAGLRKLPVEVLPMGVDMQERFVVNLSVQRAVDELLFVGRLVPKKGLRYLLEAMRIVLERRPATMLSIVGFGPEEEALKTQSRRLEIEAHVNFVGAMPQEQLPDIYRRASLFVAPFVRDESGDQEGLPVVLMEAIGCGCPVIVGDVAGIHDLLGDIASAVCVKSENPTALAAAIIDALEFPSRAQVRAQDMREAAKDRVDWQVIAEGYTRALKACIDNSTKTAD